MNKQIKKELKENIQLIEVKIKHCQQYLKELKEELKNWKQAQLQFETNNILNL